MSHTAQNAAPQNIARKPGDNIPGDSDPEAGAFSYGPPLRIVTGERLGLRSARPTMAIRTQTALGGWRRHGGVLRWPVWGVGRFWPAPRPIRRETGGLAPSGPASIVKGPPRATYPHWFALPSLTGRPVGGLTLVLAVVAGLTAAVTASAQTVATKKAAPAPPDTSPLARYVLRENLVFYLGSDGLDTQAEIWKKTAAYKILTETPLGEMLEDMTAQIAEKGVLQPEPQSEAQRRRRRHDHQAPGEGGLRPVVSYPREGERAVARGRRLRDRRHSRRRW